MRKYSERTTEYHEYTKERGTESTERSSSPTIKKLRAYRKDQTLLGGLFFTYTYVELSLSENSSHIIKLLVKRRQTQAQKTSAI